jgi:hypothetical protein
VLRDACCVIRDSWPELVEGHESRSTHQPFGIVIFTEQATCLAGTTNDENGSAASRLSVIPYKGKLCKDLLGPTDPYRMTGEFDGVYNPIFRTGHMPSWHHKR